MCAGARGSFEDAPRQRQKQSGPVRVDGVHAVIDDGGAAHGLGRGACVAQVRGDRFESDGNVLGELAAANHADALASFEQARGDQRANLAGAENDVKRAFRGLVRVAHGVILVLARTH